MVDRYPKYCPVPSTSCDRNSFNGLGGGAFTSNRTHARTYGTVRYVRTHTHTDRRTTDRLWYLINTLIKLKEKSGHNNVPDRMDDFTILKRVIMMNYNTLISSFGCAMVQFIIDLKDGIISLMN